jgi:hypothetical protein
MKGARRDRRVFFSAQKIIVFIFKDTNAIRK